MTDSHPFAFSAEIVARITARRGRLRVFDRFQASRTALVVIDMQGTFLREGAPAEVPMARAIAPRVNRLADAVRVAGGRVIWVTHANQPIGERSDWNGFFETFVAADVRMRTIESLRPGSPDTLLWPELDRVPEDLHFFKNRYSALTPGSSGLERALRGYGVENLLVAGVKTNVCCESTARDAMMLDFKVAMVSDCLAALSDGEHRATLETFIQQFGDVVTAEEAVAMLA